MKNKHDPWWEMSKYCLKKDEIIIAIGDKSNGKLGIREIYHPNYYGVFALDPDGHNVEAVCHEAE